MNQPVLKLDGSVLEKVKSVIPENMSPFSQGPDEEHYRFTSFICEYFRKRNSLKSMPNTGVSYFLFIPPENIRDVEQIGAGIASLKKNKGYDLTGKLFLCLDSSLNKTRVLTFSGGNDSVWNQLEEKTRQIETVCGQTLFHAVVDYELKTISVYFSDSETSPNSDFELVIHFGKDQERFSTDDVNNFSNEFHERETKLPTCGMMIWKNQKNLELTDKAEDRIALRFALTLSSILGKDNVSQETRGAHGRADVIIHTQAMADNQGPCVLEFKVLRNSDNEAKSEKWLRSGVLQVLDYGKDRNAKSHYLMVYDGREIRGRLATIDQETKEKNVIYLHFEMYNTVDEERKKKLDDNE